MEDCYQSKIFVGGISVDTSKDILEDHFRRYGNVVGSVIAQDRMTGNPRGFAFVSFSDASALEKVLADTHIIRGRMVCFYLFIYLYLFNHYLVYMLFMLTNDFVYYLSKVCCWSIF